MTAGFALGEVPPVPAPEEVRFKTTGGERSVCALESPWQFYREGNESMTTRVSTPHTWNNKDGQDGGGNFLRAPHWYRKSLLFPGQRGENRLILRFEGASTVAEVFLNNKPVGRHVGAFGAFCFDITGSINGEGGPNLLAVRVDNSPNPDVPPLSGDFTVFGGLYRSVRILEVPSVCIYPLDDGSSGVYLKLKRGRSSAKVEVTATVKVWNARTFPVKRSVHVRLARAGAPPSDATVPVKLAPGEVRDVAVPVEVLKPAFWDGRNGPALYNVSAEIVDGTTVVDQVSFDWGLRSFKLTAGEGLSLNGKRYPIHGVNRHQDRPDLGWAVDPDLGKQDAAYIADLGCTGVRAAHYQHSQEFYGECDKLGLVVWAEIPLIDKLGTSQVFDENAKSQLRELIKQNFNHPSILFWSLSNELNFAPEDKPERWKLIGELNALAKQLDPGRVTVAASNHPRLVAVNSITDALAINAYPGWYKGAPEEFGKRLDEARRLYANRPLGVSEYGAGASITQHEWPPVKPQHNGPWHPEEYQAYLHEVQYRQIQERPWLWCTFVWNMFDFASDRRREGDTPGRNDKGLVTYDRSTQKDAYYFYRANWAADPQVHICSSRFSPRPAGKTAVTVYSNFESVDLLLDGRSLGPRKPDSVRVARWDNVNLAPGSHKVEAVCKRGNKELRDSCTWEVVEGPIPTPTPYPKTVADNH